MKNKKIIEISFVREKYDNGVVVKSKEIKY